MPLTKERILDKVEVLEDGTIQIRYATYILEDGQRITDAQYHREVTSPGDPVASQPGRVQAIATAVWTPSVIAAYRARRT
jgi:hypothetical protein